MKVEELRQTKNFYYIGGDYEILWRYLYERFRLFRQQLLPVDFDNTSYYLSLQERLLERFLQQLLLSACGAHARLLLLQR